MVGAIKYFEKNESSLFRISAIPMEVEIDDLPDLWKLSITRYMLYTMVYLDGTWYGIDMVYRYVWYIFGTILFWQFCIYFLVLPLSVTRCVINLNVILR